MASSATSLGVKPRRAARTGSTWKLVAGPEMVLSTPLCVSTTPGIFLMASSTLGPSWFNRAASLEKSLIWMGSGELERSPIMSWSTWMNSTSRAGSDFLILSRTSAMISSMSRSRLGLRRTLKSPELASVTAASPSLQPGAAAGDLDLGGAAQDLLDVLEDAVGLGQRGARWGEVVEDERALVHLGQQIGA